MILKLLKNLKHNIPKQLLKTNVTVDQNYKKQVLQEIEIEREWYRGVPGYNSFAEMQADLEQGKLVKVVGDTNYLPILRLRNPKLVEEYPPFLTKEARALLDEIGRRWRIEMDKQGIGGNIRFAVTSLSRTLDYQKTLIEAGKLADPESVHTRGEAFDIDASGYYLNDTPINARAGKQNVFANAFKGLSAELDGPKFGDYALYSPRPHQILKEILQKMRGEDLLHFVHEFPETKNDVFHVCRNPR